MMEETIEEIIARKFPPEPDSIKNIPTSIKLAILRATVTPEKMEDYWPWRNLMIERLLPYFVRTNGSDQG
jgi:hypothetical protein